MAEFVQTMKDWMRMCLSYKSCDDCPMWDEDGWAHTLCSEGGIRSAVPEIQESVIANWVAEHPKPVYPTWQEWFDTFDQTIDVDEPIPADIAEKLGIEPKEEC